MAANEQAKRTSHETVGQVI